MAAARRRQWPRRPRRHPVGALHDGHRARPLWTRDGLATNGVGPLAAGEVVVAGTPRA
ncbi:hypothetical protein SAZ11_53520 [Streptomyces sp. FXJ1.4098]|nr:hypothetical protein [Streptomyces sp. FXJ1.4098]